VNSDNLKVLIAGGGTGGHLFPAIAIGDQLKKNNIKVKYIGSKYGIEASYKFIDKEDISLLDLKGIQRSFSIKHILMNLFLPIRVIKSFYQVNKIIKKFKPDMIIGTGGYSCAIPLYLGIKNKILTAIQEQNVIPGMVTKKFHSKVNFVFTSFKETEEYLNNKNLLFTGNPIRATIKATDMKDAKNRLNLSPEKFTILIMGGSQGARSINQHIAKNYQKYINNNIQIIWQTGKNSNNLTMSISNSEIKIFEFIDEMNLVYSASDLVISRAGATAISEILFLEKPSILIPYPYAANNHQEVNAITLEKENAAIKIDETEFETGKLEKVVFEFSKSTDKINFYKKNAKKYSTKDSASLIKKHVMEIIANAR